jgi:hypothetical protein
VYGEYRAQGGAHQEERRETRDGEKRDDDDEFGWR